MAPTGSTWRKALSTTGVISAARYPIRAGAHKSAGTAVQFAGDPRGAHFPIDIMATITGPQAVNKMLPTA